MCRVCVCVYFFRIVENICSSIFGYDFKGQQSQHVLRIIVMFGSLITCVEKYTSALQY